MDRSEYLFQGIPFVFAQNGITEKILELAKKYAPLSNPVLITGETGTGKEQLVKILHVLSGRPGKLVSVNLSAIPKELIENELFGHVKGAYTDANTTTEGLIEKAAYGSLYIDEIGDIPLEYQMKLLRVIQDNEFEKIGSHKTLKSTARFLITSSKDLEKEVQEYRFRSDLYYRISAFHIHLPPLRERKEDLPLLMDYFLRLVSQKYHRELRLHPEVRQRFLEYDWPGNIRELENLIFRLAITVERNEITLEDLPAEYREMSNIDLKIMEWEKRKKELMELEKELLKELVNYYHGNLYKVSKKLKISRGAVQYKVKKYRLTLKKHEDTITH